jgi:hypothetical protein
MPNDAQADDLERFHNNVETGQADRIGWLEAIVRVVALHCEPGCSNTINVSSEGGVITASCACGHTFRLDTNGAYIAKCPLSWCQGVGVLIDRVIENYPPEHNTYRVHCSLHASRDTNHCEVAGPVRDTEAEAVQAWNGY